tara:strand:+ start:3503 stop:3850 length:348 start_codon:yes stop_codon:yes gene_type:complete
MADDATARKIVDLAMDDKPNAAGEVMNDILLDKIGDQVQGMKDAISNDMFGQDIPDAEPVEVQPELDLEPVDIEEPDQEESEETYEADQEAIEEPGEVEVEEIEPEESEEEKEEQ